MFGHRGIARRKDQREEKERKEEEEKERKRKEDLVDSLGVW